MEIGALPLAPPFSADSAKGFGGDRKATEKLFKAVSLGALPLTPPLFCDDRKGGKSVFFSLSQIKETKEILSCHAFRNLP